MFFILNSLFHYLHDHSHLLTSSHNPSTLSQTSTFPALPNTPLLFTHSFSLLCLPIRFPFLTHLSLSLSLSTPPFPLPCLLILSFSHSLPTHSCQPLPFLTLTYPFLSPPLLTLPSPFPLPNQTTLSTSPFPLPSTQFITHQPCHSALHRTLPFPSFPFPGVPSPPKPASQPASSSPPAQRIHTTRHGNYAILLTFIKQEYSWDLAAKEEEEGEEGDGGEGEEMREEREREAGDEAGAKDAGRAWVRCRELRRGKRVKKGI